MHLIKSSLFITYKLEFSNYYNNYISFWETRIDFLITVNNDMESAFYNYNSNYSFKTVAILPIFKLFLSNFNKTKQQRI